MLFQFNVIATDGFGQSAPFTCTFTVFRNNFGPVINSAYSVDIPENFPVNQVVFDLNATDADSRVGVISFVPLGMNMNKRHTLCKLSLTHYQMTKF